MDADRWERVWHVFHAALERTESERAGFVEAECGSDESLRSEVFALLRSHESAHTFLEDPLNPRPASPEGMIGELVDRYRVRSVIGSGGMGTVFLAEQEEPIQRTVALKVIKLGMDTAEIVSRFELERQKLAELNHPNVALVLDAGATENGRPYFVMEYIPGIPITEYCDANRLGIRDRIELFLPVCEALEHAHRRGTLHRDIKPSNVLVEVVDTRAVPKVIDFGLAKVVDRRTRIATPDTGYGRAIGTPEFMSPEQASGVSNIDGRTDVYSLGMLLYVLLVGSHPLVDELQKKLPQDFRSKIRDFDTPRPSARLKQLGEDHNDIAERRATNLESLDQQIRGDLDNIVMKATARERDDRYGSASELAADLKRHTSSEPVLAAPRRKRPARLAVPVIAALLVVLVGGMGLAIFRSLSSERVALAVLPFTTVGGDPQQDYFSDGLTTEIIYRLGGIAPEDLQVIGHTTMLRYKNGEKSTAEIAEELKVAYLIEGSVKYEGDRLWINARLIRAKDQFQLWADSFETTTANVITTQLKLALNVARNLPVEVLPKRSRIDNSAVVDPLAYKANLNGRHFRSMVSENGLRKAIEHFQVALDHDSKFADAYAGMAACYCLLSGHGLEVDPSGALMPKVKDMAESALALDDELSEAHGALGMAKLKYDWDWNGARTQFQRAIELDPSNPLARIWYSFYLSSQGRHNEAIAQVETARELDPFSKVSNVNVAWQYYMARRYEKAIEEFHHTLELFPEFWVALWGRGLVQIMRGFSEEAVADLELAVERSRKNQSALSGLGLAFAHFGRREEARGVVTSLTEISQNSHVPPTSIAAIHGALGDIDEAFEWLEKAYLIRSRSMVWLRVGHEFDPLRGDPRYQDLLRRMRLNE